MVLDKKNALLFSFLIFSSFLLCSNANAQIQLNQGNTSFIVSPFNFAFTSLSGTLNYLNVFWNIQEPGAAQVNISVSCTLTGLSIVDCLPKPFIQGPGQGSCSVNNPPYNFFALNNISCFSFYIPNSTLNSTNTISFYPLAVNANASLGSLTVGQQVQLRVNIQNIGLIKDNYTVNITSPASYIFISNPIASTGFLNGNPTNESSYTQTGVIAGASLGQTRIDIAVNSTVNPAIGQIIHIQLTAGLASLPDFTIFGIIQIIILAALILLLKK